MTTDRLACSIPLSGSSYSSSTNSSGNRTLCSRAIWHRKLARSSVWTLSLVSSIFMTTRVSGAA